MRVDARNIPAGAHGIQINVGHRREDRFLAQQRLAAKPALQKSTRYLVFGVGFARNRLGE